MTILDVIMLKKNSVKESSHRDFNRVIQSLEKHVDLGSFCSSLTYDDWLDVAKKVLETPSFRGCVRNKISISISTLRNIFASLSSCFSYARSMGVDIKNIPLDIVQNYINPKLKENKNNKIKE